MFNIVTLFSALLVSQVSATALQDRSSLIRGLVARQVPTPSIPSQCQTQCQTLNTLNSCSDITCMCTTAVDQGLHTCVSCINGLGASSTATASILSQFESTCAEAGFPITSSSGTSGLTTTAAFGTTTATGLTTLVPSATLPASATVATGQTVPPVNTGLTSTIKPINSGSAATSTVNPFGKSGGALGLKSPNVGVLVSVMVVVWGAGYVMA